MFGMNFSIKNEKLSICLRPAVPDDIPKISIGLSNFKTNLWTTLIGAPTIEMEKEWHERISKSNRDYAWIIASTDTNEPIGIVSLNEVDDIGSCTQGLAIWDQEWWGKGVASLVSLASIWFACDQINRSTIRAYVREPNVGAIKVAEKIGFTLWGTQPGVFFRNGAYANTCYLLFVNPKHQKEIFTKEVPKNFEDGIVKADKALELARSLISY